VTLCITESQSFTTETVIKTADVSGSDGYTCQMISKVTADYTISDTVDGLSQTFALVNVMESSTACGSNFKAADICTMPLSTSGSSVTANAVAYNPEGLFYYLADNIVYYGQSDSTGLMLTTSAFTGGSLDNLVIGSDGSFYSSYSSKIYKYVASTGTWTELTGVTFTSTPVIVQDNLNNLYYTLIDECGGVYSLSVSGTVMSSVLLFTPASGCIECGPPVYNDDGNYDCVGTTVSCTGGGDLAVYNPGTGAANIEYYYTKFMCTYTYPTYFSFVVEKYVNGVTSTVLTINGGSDQGTSTYVPPVLWAVDNTGRVAIEYTTADSGGSYSVYWYQLYGGSGQVTNLPTTSTTSKFDPSFSTLAYGTSLFSVADQESSPMFLSYQAFSSSWMTCGPESVTPVPSNGEDYPLSCSLNGVVGSTSYNYQYPLVFTTASAAETYMMSDSCTYSEVLTDAILTAVGDLPPYSCQKKIYPDFFEVLGSAVANTEFLLLLLIMFFAAMLERLAARYPPSPLRKDGDVPGVEEGKDLEMCPVAANPLHVDSKSTGIADDRIRLLEEHIKLSDQRMGEIEAALILASKNVKK